MLDEGENTLRDYFNSQFLLGTIVKLKSGGEGSDFAHI
jgi:hypothetical protein